MAHTTGRGTEREISAGRPSGLFSASIEKCGSMTETRHGAVCVLGEDAEEYRPLLATLEAEGTEIRYFSGVESMRSEYAGQNVLLAPPDLAAEALSFADNLCWIQSTWALVP